MIGLPIPRLTATIQPPPNRHVLGVVTIYDPTPPVRPPTVSLPARVKAVHHCSRCVAAGLNGAGHNSRSKHCPTMGCITGGGPTGLDYQSNFTAVIADQVTDQDSDEVLGDVAHLATIDVTPLDALVEMLEAASSHSDRSLIPAALDRLLEYLDHWSASSPGRVVALFDRLNPSRLVRAVGQTLLASTRLAGDRSAARREFLVRFLDDLRNRGTSEAKAVCR
jgi:hypothetical protein